VTAERETETFIGVAWSDWLDHLVILLTIAIILMVVELVQSELRRDVVDDRANTPESQLALTRWLQQSPPDKQ